MTNIRTRVLSTVLAVVVLFSAVTVTASAAGAEDWRTAYINFILSKDFPKAYSVDSEYPQYKNSRGEYVKIQSEFALTDVDMNGIPELIAYQYEPSHSITIYTYDNGVIWVTAADIPSTQNYTLTQGFVPIADSTHHGFLLETNSYEYSELYGIFPNAMRKPQRIYFIPYENGKLGESTLLSNTIAKPLPETETEKTNPAPQDGTVALPKLTSYYEETTYSDHPLAEQCKNGTLKTEHITPIHYVERAVVSNAVNTYAAFKAGSAATHFSAKRQPYEAFQDNGDYVDGIPALPSPVTKYHIAVNWDQIDHAKYAIYYISRNNATGKLGDWTVLSLDENVHYIDFAKASTYYITVLPYTDTPTRPYGGFSPYAVVKT